ncbi:hypothetical protein ABW19_dt0206477 [Dactylella cylindrospora]|nr:hypothetical protein ABW19_dt0206477 [Dactylella cylindrospora]
MAKPLAPGTQSWGYQSIDCADIGRDHIRIFYQTSNNALRSIDYNVSNDTFYHSQLVVAANNVMKKTPILALCFSAGSTPYATRLYYCNAQRNVVELKNPAVLAPAAQTYDGDKSGILRDGNPITLSEDNPALAGTYYYNANSTVAIRLFCITKNKVLREFIYNHKSSKKWELGAAVQNPVDPTQRTRLICPYPPIEIQNPTFNLLGFDGFVGVCRWLHGLNSSGGDDWIGAVFDSPGDIPMSNNMALPVVKLKNSSEVRPFCLMPVSGDCKIVERQMTDKLKWKEPAVSQTFDVEALHPFAVIADQYYDGDENHMYLFMTDGENFWFYERGLGRWYKKLSKPLSILEASGMSAKRSLFSLATSLLWS